MRSAILKFDGHYDHWSILMENFLHSKDYWGSCNKQKTSFSQMPYIEDQKLKDLKAKNYLFQALDRSILKTILRIQQRTYEILTAEIPRFDTGKVCTFASSSKGV